LVAPQPMRKKEKKNRLNFGKKNQEKTGEKKNGKRDGKGGKIVFSNKKRGERNGVKRPKKGNRGSATV